MKRYSVMVMSTIMILLGAVALHADYTGNNYSHGAEPPTAGVTQPNAMDQLPSPNTSDINRTPAAPDTKNLYQPTCEVDSSLMNKYRQQNPGLTDTQPQDVQIGSFSCRA